MLKKLHKVGQRHAAVPPTAKWPSVVAVVLLGLALGACGEKNKAPGQSLASVNGEEITVLQLNEELQRSNVPQPQQQAASKQLLDSLIERQLLTGEAVKEKLDRDPRVVQSIERAKAMILAQAYLQKHMTSVAKPTPAEVADYYAKHPAFFANNKVFDMRQLVLATKDVTPELKAVIDSAKSLDEVAAWMESHQVKFGRGQLSRSSADLPPELSAKLLAMAKNQLFIVREGERSLLIVLTDIKDRPVTQEAAAPQIEQFLFNQKNKEAAAAEVARLRAAAKIEYLNKQMAPGADAPAAAAAAAAPAASAPEAAKPAINESTERGAAGLK
ncbi:EpsD family peptidyl-prolyl cis-trans isomerase [Duganella caerulea]|uniref:EpsD family peptidyl-prolyl cis-trans isomerase n=1 Tax=Duganella caerulea TaxID=2885762 RepID=UPI004038439A